MARSISTNWGWGRSTRSRRCTASGVADLLDAWSMRCRRPSLRQTGGSAAVRIAHRRPAERRQVVAAQPPAGRRARDRQPDPGHHARCHRHPDLEWEGKPIIADRHGRHPAPGQVEQGRREYSVLRALAPIERADVALLVIDAMEASPPRTRTSPASSWRSGQERGGGGQQVGRGRRRQRRRWLQYALGCARQLRFLDYVPVLFVSALDGQRVDEVLPTALAVHAARHRRSHHRRAQPAGARRRGRARRRRPRAAGR